MEKIKYPKIFSNHCSLQYKNPLIKTVFATVLQEFADCKLLAQFSKNFPHYLPKIRFVRRWVIFTLICSFGLSYAEFSTESTGDNARLCIHPIFNFFITFGVSQKSVHFYTYYVISWKICEPLKCSFEGSLSTLLHCWQWQKALNTLRQLQKIKTTVIQKACKKI